jgi:hypothetical protein
VGKKELVWRYSWRGGYKGIDGMKRGKGSYVGGILGGGYRRIDGMGEWKNELV